MSRHNTSSARSSWPIVRRHRPRIGLHTTSAGAVALLLLLAGGCAQVKPWQRGTLADPIMQPDRDPLAAGLIDHVYFSREAATGGRTHGGAGCGCN